MQAVEASLKRLRTDWIDLYQLHRPDPQTPIEETLRALDDLVRQGKVRFIGCSNLSAQQVDRGAGHRAPARAGGVRVLPGRVQPAGARHRARARSGGEGARPRASCPISRSPAACSPASTGAARRCRRARGWRRTRATPTSSSTSATGASSASSTAFAARRGRSMLELAFSWLLRDGVVASVIAGATTPEQVEQNVARRGLDTLGGGVGRDRPHHGVERQQVARKGRAPHHDDLPASSPPS